MSSLSFNEVISTCNEFMSTKLEMSSINEPLLTAVAEGLGSAIYHPDASLVACSDKSETHRVKTNFLIGTLQLADSKELDDAIAAVCKQMGQSNRKKYRVVFYYLLLQHFGLESKFLASAEPVAEAVVEAVVETAPVVEAVVEAAPVAEAVVEAAPVAEAVVEAAPVVEEVVEVAPVVISHTVVEAAPVAEAVVEAAPVVEEVVEAAPVVISHTVVEAAPVAEAVVEAAPVVEEVHAPLLETITQSLGSHATTSHIHIHDESERYRIREHFLRGRLGLHHIHHDELNAAIHAVHEKMGPEPEKNRAAFYYHLTKHFGAEQTILNPVPSNLF